MTWPAERLTLLRQFSLKVAALKVTAVLAVFSALVGSRSSFSQWNFSELKVLQSYPAPFSDEIFPMVWTSIQQSISGVKKIAGAKEDRVSVPGFLDELPYLQAFQRDEHGLLKKADLVVMVNGFFEDHHGDLDAADVYYQLGYHVAVIPTSLTEVYAKASPREFKPGNLYDESRLTIEIIEQIKNVELGKEKVTQTHYWGTSWGATNGLIMRSRDEQSRAPVVDGKYFLVAPILNVDFGVHAFDSLIQSFCDNYKSKPIAHFFNALTVLRKVKQNDSPETILDQSDLHSRELVGGYVLNRLKNIIKVLEKKLGQQLLGYQRVHERNRSRLRLGSKYLLAPRARRVRIHYPSGKPFSCIKLDDVLTYSYPVVQSQYKSIEGKMRYWLNSVDEINATSDVKIFFSADDPILDPKEMKFFRNDRRVHILKDGGHLGFTEMDWYKDLLEEVF